MAKRIVSDEDMYPGAAIAVDGDDEAAPFLDPQGEPEPDDVETDSTPARTPTLAAALVAAQRAVRRVAKGSTNQFHRYQYASSEDVIDAARRNLSEHGLSLTRLSALPGEMTRSRFMSEKETGGAAGTFTEEMITVSSKWLLLHESGESQVFDSFTVCQAEKGRPWDKAVSGALTISLSYFLRDLLLIPKGDDEDADIEKRDDRAYDPQRSRVTPESKLGVAGAIRVKKKVADADLNQKDLRKKIEEKFTVPDDMAEWPSSWEKGVDAWIANGGGA